MSICLRFWFLWFMSFTEIIILISLPIYFPLFQSAKWENISSDDLLLLQYITKIVRWTERKKVRVRSCCKDDPLCCSNCEFNSILLYFRWRIIWAVVAADRAPYASWKRILATWKLWKLGRTDVTYCSERQPRGKQNESDFLEMVINFIQVS